MRSFFLAVLALMAPGLGTIDGAQQASRLDRLRWMAGCWEGTSGGVTTEEHWMRPAGGTMIGMSRTVRRDTTVSHESMRIVERGGAVVFLVQPSGQAAAEFTAVEVKADAVVFANPQHDFPQRILYRRVGADSIVARIEGMNDGRAQGIDFRYARTACP